MEKRESEERERRQKMEAAGWATGVGDREKLERLSGGYTCLRSFCDSTRSERRATKEIMERGSPLRVTMQTQGAFR